MTEELINDIISKKEIMELFHCNEGQLRYWITSKAKGFPKHIKLSPQLFRKSEVLEWMRKQMES